MGSITAEHLYQRYYPRVYQRIYSLVGHREQAEDLTQETFCKALCALPHLRSTENLSGWLYRIATNTAYDSLRRRKLIAWQPLDLDEALGFATPDIQEHYPTQEAVRRALAHVPPGYQRALILSILEGYSLAEMATHLGIRPRGAKMYLKRAREAFRACYAREVSAS